MNAQELRIGNIIAFGDNQVIVKGIHTDTVLYNKPPHIYVDLNNKLPYQCFALNDLSPIPITPAILEAAGFELSLYEKPTYCKMVGGIGIYLQFKKYGLYQVLAGTPGAIGCKLKYVHQLQNRVQSLTNTELTITLPQ